MRSLGAWPERDGLAADGCAWIGPGPRRMPRAELHRHSHTTPDGTVVRVESQYIQMAGCVLDRFYVGPWFIGTANRAGDPAEPPAFAWADQRARQEVPA